MDIAAILAIVELLVKTVPQIVQTGIDLKPYAEGLWNQFNGGKELTDAERVQLRAGVDALYDRLVQPLPPAQPGDPDYAA